MNTVLFFDEINGLSDGRKKTRVDVARKMSGRVKNFFNAVRDDIRSGEFLREKSREDYEDELFDLYLAVASGWIDLDDDDLISHQLRFARNVMDTTVKIWLSAEGDEHFQSARLSGLPLKDIYIPDSVVTALGSERAERIGANESLYINNKSEYDRAVADGKGYHIWNTRRDDRVRPTHVVADRQKRPIDEMFTVGGYALAFPGDTEHGAPPEETVNCRCFLTYL